MKMKWFRIAIFLGFAASGALVSTAAVALDRNCVTELLTPLVAPLKKSLTTPEERKLIESWFHDSSMSFEEASRAAFDLVFRKRLELLPDDLAKKVLEVFESRVQEVTYRDINGFFSPKKNRIGTQNPRELMNTPVEHANLLHEVEHAVQHHWITEEEALRILNHDKVALAFEHEYGAMLAEWQYISALPPSVRERMIEETMKLNLPYGITDHIQRSFRNAALEDPEQYVMREWRAGRYSWEAIEEHISGNASVGPARKKFAALIASSFIYLYACLEMKRKHATQTEFFKKVCSPLYLNP